MAIELEEREELRLLESEMECIDKNGKLSFDGCDECSHMKCEGERYSDLVKRLNPVRKKELYDSSVGYE